MSNTVGLPLYLQLEAVLHGGKVRKAIDDVADRLESLAKQLGDPDDAGQIGREDGNRPKVDRPYARVTARTEVEFGSAMHIRERMLGRAVEQILAEGPRNL